MSRLRGEKILPLFGKYLQYGYYPYYKTTGKEYFQRLEETVRQVIENDLPAIEDINYSTIVKVKRMLMLLARCVPQTPKMSQLYSTLETTRDMGMKMLYTLERANLLALLTYEPKSLRLIQKPDKFYLGDTNLMYAMVNDVNVGTVRETFFYNQLQTTHEIHLAKQGDFVVDGTYTFEIGGRTKDFSHIKDIPNSYVATDETEYKVFNKIPLWLFGMMY